MTKSVQTCKANKNIYKCCDIVFVVHVLTLTLHACTVPTLHMQRTCTALFQEVCYLFYDVYCRYNPGAGCCTPCTHAGSGTSGACNGPRCISGMSPQMSMTPGVGVAWVASLMIDRELTSWLHVATQGQGASRTRVGCVPGAVLPCVIFSQAVCAPRYGTCSASKCLITEAWVSEGPIEVFSCQRSSPELVVICNQRPAS